MKNFSTGLEHLSAELQVINLLLLRQVKRLRAANLLTEDEMRGFYIPDAYVDSLLSQSMSQGTHGPPGDESQEIQLLTAVIEKMQQEILERVTNSQALPLPRLAMLFDLKPFEIQVLLVCLAPELDLRFETFYAYAQNDVTRTHPTVDLALKLLSTNFEERVAYRGVFDSNAPLFRYKLIRLFDDPQDRDPTLLSRYLKVDQRIVDFLLEKDTIDQNLLPFTRLIDPSTQMGDFFLPGELSSRLPRIIEFFKQNN